MVKTLVVVESPAKAKTIKKYLGSGFDVVASKGHIKDLPKKLGIDIEKGFQETYEVVPGQGEGPPGAEAGGEEASTRSCSRPTPTARGRPSPGTSPKSSSRAKKTTKRVEFHEITKKGVEYGVSHPRELDKNLYDAQRARRVLDRIVGYDVSALVWSKLAFGLSAGRVQSVALRLIVDREREIEAFVPEEYWNCGAALAPAATAADAHSFIGAPGVARRREARASRTASEAATVRADLERARYRRREGHQERAQAQRARAVHDEQAAAGRRQSPRLRRQARDADRAGALRRRRSRQGRRRAGRPHHVHAYRLDAPVARRGRTPLASYIAAKYGKECVPAQPNVFKSKKNAQDAHEAIRPTSLDLTPESVRKHLKDEQFKLYKLIWERFVASPDDAGRLRPDERRHRGHAGQRRESATYGLRASGRVLKFSGLARGVRQGRDREVGAARGRERRRQGRRRATARRTRRPRTAPRAVPTARISWPRTLRLRSRSSPRGRRCTS